MKDIVNVDILIAGGGSAGFGAAYTACLIGGRNYTVAVIDKNNILGGTSTAAGVTAWEMGIGGPGVHRELACRLLALDNEAAILKGNWKPLLRTRPYAIASPDDKYIYKDTLRAAGVHDRVNNHNSFIFEPRVMADEMLIMLSRAGGDNFTFYNNETIMSVKTADGKVSEVHTKKYVFKPKIIIDCTGDITVARMTGCETELGAGNSGRNINGVTQVYRVEKKAYASIDIVPKKYCPPYKDKAFEKKLDNVRIISSINTYPNSDLNINPLPTMDGDEFFAMNREDALMICRGRVYLHWRRMQSDSPLMRNYKIKEIYTMIGIRESYRLKGEHILSADDVLSGFGEQNRRDEIIAFSDHPIDIHGGVNPGLKILDKPYGIPYGCILPQNISNMLVACRGSSFDSTAAASCRLSRTMISLGEAAGVAAVISLDSKKQPHDADVGKVRELLGLPAFTEKLSREYDL